MKWYFDFAQRVIFEYRRFIYLVAVCGEMTPSKVVDEVWHLHLEDTESYFTKFAAM